METAPANHTSRQSAAREAAPWWRRRWFLVHGLLTVLLCLTLVLAAEYLLHNAEPLLSKRITDTLSARFHAPVTLDELSISLLRGLQVEGTGLRIGYPAGIVAPDHPMIEVDRFQFRTGLLSLLRESLLHHPTHIAFVRVEGLQLHIPPTHTSAEPEPRLPHPSEGLALHIDQLQCRDVRIFLESSKPDPTHTTVNGRTPLEFRISTLNLQHVAPHQAMLYDAQLINPKPVGAIHIHGHFGPWAGAQANDSSTDTPNAQPGQTPIDGDYTFDHVNLHTIQGIAGTLNSTGHFAGTLNRLTVIGHTDTPNFSLGIADHPMPLHTDFHATVDGTTGDTYLTPVHAWLAGSAFTATGKVVDVKGFGHDIQLDLDIPHGRMQDFLRLAVKTSPPLLSGALAMHARLHLPPGNTPVPQKISLAGTFNLASAQFSNPPWQAGINNLSARATGHPEQVAGNQATRNTQTHSQLAANFTLEHGILSVTDMRYSIPGALVLMNGVYSTDGKLFEFKGHVRTAATASAMVGGWQGLLLSPFDGYLQNNGAGVELPIEVSGTQGNIHLGLALGGADDQPAQLLTDIRNRTAAGQQLGAARGLAAQAAAEDRAAAQAATLEEAQRHHNNAVRLRKQATPQPPRTKNQELTTYNPEPTTPSTLHPPQPASPPERREPCPPDTVIGMPSPTQGELFRENADAPGTKPPVKDKGSNLAPVWLQRLSLGMLVVFCFYIGGLVAVLPWSPRYWDANAWITGHPLAADWLLRGWVRGLISGLGLIDLWIGVSELLHYRDGRR